MIFDHVYTFLIHKKFATRFFITFLAFIICFGLWFFVFYVQLSETKNLLLADIHGLEQKRRLRSNLLKESNDASSKINQLEQKYKDLFSDNCNVGCVIKLAKSHGLKMISCLEEEVVLIKFSMQGQFDQVFDFLQQIGILEIPIECKDFSMSFVKENLIQIDCKYKFYGYLIS